MQAAIGNSLLAKLKAKDKPYDVRDSKLTGFLVRVNVTGKLVYMCEYKRGKRVTLGKVGILSAAQARDMAKEVLGDAAKGIDPRFVNKKNSIITLKAFLENEYKPWVEVHRKDAARTVGRIKRCFYKLFSNKPLNEITGILIEQWRIQRFKLGRSVETVNRDIATFKAALSKAVEWSFIDEHPLAKLKLLKVDNNRKVRYLTVAEEIRLREALDHREEELKKARERGNSWRAVRGYKLMSEIQDQYFADYLKPMILLSINTGVRQGELFNLSWDSIDFSRSILTVGGEVSKSGKTRHIPLNSEAHDILYQWHYQSIDKKLVFPSKNNNKFYTVKKAWANILDRAEITEFRWHDLRHHFASKLVMASVDLNTVRELLGHSDIKMTLRYAHLAPEHKANAVAKLVAK